MEAMEAVELVELVEVMSRTSAIEVECDDLDDSVSELSSPYFTSPNRRDAFKRSSEGHHFVPAAATSARPRQAAGPTVAASLARSLTHRSSTPFAQAPPLPSPAHTAVSGGGAAVARESIAVAADTDASYRSRTPYALSSKHSASSVLSGSQEPEIKVHSVFYIRNLLF